MRDADRHAPRPEPAAARIGVRRIPAVAEIGGHAELKAAARDWQRFSSDLQGDIDVRDYRQLPLEADPPAHGAYRAVLAPIFERQRVATLEPALRELARPLVRGLRVAGHVEAVTELALPMVTASIGIAFGRPQDSDEYRSWGTDAWQTRPDGTRDGSTLERYLDRVFREVREQPGEDAFSVIARGTVEGRPLSDVEQRGMGNLILAGGRDTVIHLIAGALWYLGGHVAERQRLARDPRGIPGLLEELLRFLSPLPAIERITTEPVSGEWGSALAGEFVLLGFAQADHDRRVFGDPEVIRAGRNPNPHVAFGNGPHTCIGVHLARLEARVFLEEMVAAVPDWRLGAGAEIQMSRIGRSQVPTHFVRLPVEVVW
jgi:cytochrome P450